MNTNNSTCYTFSEREVSTIFTIRVTVASLSLAACLLAFLVLCVLICCVRVWKTFVHRLKLYLMAVALVVSVMYLLQVLPTRSAAVMTPDAARDLQEEWHSRCAAIAFLLQYFDWMLLLLICWMVLYVLWLVQRVGKPLDDFHFHYYQWLEVGVVVFTLIFPLLFLWTPFISDDYGLEDIWCGNVLRRHSLCSNTNQSIEPGLGYLLGTWYIPGLILTSLCTVGIFVVIGYVWVYYRRKGLTNKLKSTIIQGLPPIMYLIAYNIISGLDIASLIYHYNKNVTRGGAVDYQLWKTHAVTGPCRALAIPVAFLVGNLFVRICFKKKSTQNDLR